METTTIAHDPLVTVSGVLWHAADLIEEHGWTQGTMYRNKGAQLNKRTWSPGCSMCAVGAVQLAACGNLDIGEAAYDALQDFLDADALTIWNDADGRTSGEVTSALRAAAGQVEAMMV